MPIALREILASFGYQIDDSELKKADSELDSLMKKAREAGKVLASAFVIKKFADFASAMINAGDQVAKTAQQLSLSVDQYQRMRFAADSAGVSMEQLTVGINMLAKNAVESTKGNKTLAQAFRELGISVKDSNGRFKTSQQIFREVADGTAKIQDPINRTRLLMVLLGESGGKLGPLLSGGSAALDKLSQRFDKFGGGLSKKFVKQTEQAKDALLSFSTASQVLSARFLQLFLPSITSGINALGRLIAVISQSEAAVFLLQVAFAALTGATAAWAANALIALGVPLLPLLAMVAIVGLIIGLVDDIWVAFTGGKSVIGELITQLKGPFAVAWAYLKSAALDATKAIFNALNGAIVWLREGIRSVAGYVADLFKSVVQSAVNLGHRVRAALAQIPGVGKLFSSAGINVNQTAVTQAQSAITAVQGVTGGLGAAGPTVAPSAAVAPSAGGPTTNNAAVNRGPTNITINGVTDPDAVAAAVRRQMPDADDDLTAAYAALSRSAG